MNEAFSILDELEETKRKKKLWSVLFVLQILRTMHERWRILGRKYEKAAIYSFNMCMSELRITISNSEEKKQGKGVKTPKAYLVSTL